MLLDLQKKSQKNKKALSHDYLSHMRVRTYAHFLTEIIADLPMSHGHLIWMC